MQYRMRVQNKEFPSALSTHTLYRVLLLERLDIDFLLSNLFKMSLGDHFSSYFEKKYWFSARSILPFRKCGNTQKILPDIMDKFPSVKCLKVNVLIKEYDKTACKYQSCVKVSFQENLCV